MAWKRERGVAWSQRQERLAYLFLSPLLVFIGVLALYPTLVTVVQAFFRVNPLMPPQEFIGLDNFRAVLTSEAVNRSWINTGLYALSGVVLSTTFGVAIALALRKHFPLRSIVLALVILPWALPPVVEGLVWAWIYDPGFGVLNSVLHSLHVIDTYHVWIGTNHFLTILLIELVQVWQMTPLSALIVLGALQIIPDELQEAAAVDGANRWQAVKRITLPLIRPAIAVAVVQSLVLSLNIFDEVYILNGAAYAGSSVMLQTYFITFQNLDFGQGYALSLLLTLVTVVLAFISFRIIYRRVEL